MLDNAAIGNISVSDLGTALGTAASFAADLKCLGRGALPGFRRPTFLKPAKTDCQLPQIVPGGADRQFTCSAHRIRGLPPERRKCGCFRVFR
jgi:hypothetical protein